MSSALPDSCSVWVPSGTVAHEFEKLLVVASEAKSALGHCTKVALRLIVRSDKDRGIDIALLQGLVGIEVPYCQLFIQAMSTRSVDGSPLKGTAA